MCSDSCKAFVDKMATNDASEAGMSFAEKMMKKMGWTEGKGLGKDEAGMKDFIKPKMKFNTKGSYATIAGRVG